MIKTEKKYWVNRYDSYKGGRFYSYSFSIFNIGVIINWGKDCRKIFDITLYKLI